MWVGICWNVKVLSTRVSVWTRIICDILEYVEMLR